MKFEWKSCFKIVISIFILYLAIIYWHKVADFVTLIFSAASPIIIGCIIAYLVNILLNFYEKLYFPNSKKSFVLKSRRLVCLILSFLTLIAIISLVISLIVPQLISCVKLLVEKLPIAINYVISVLERLNLFSDETLSALSSIDWQSKLGEIANAVTSGIGNVVDFVIAIISGLFSGIVTAFLSLIFAIYLLLGKDKLSQQLKRAICHYLPNNIYNKLFYIFSVFNDCFHKYIVGQCTEAVILGVLCFIGMILLQLPYAAMISALIAFTALIPIAGAYIGAAVGAFMILTLSPIKALFFLIFIIILQQVEGNLIYPRVVGTSIGLPAIWVLAAITLGGGIAGIPGMLFGVPLAAALYRLIKNNIIKNAD